MFVRPTVAMVPWLCVAASSPAGVISFSFTPPPAGGTMTNIANAGGIDTGLLVFNQNAPLNFTLDATSEGAGVHTYPNARMSMSMTLAPAQDLGGGFFRATVQGNFAIYDYTGNVRSDIIQGALTGGSFLHFGTSNVIILSSNTGLSYTAGPALSAILPSGSSLVPAYDGTFAISNVRNILGGDQILLPNNAFDTFFATTAFTGSANVVVPTPGAIVLSAIGAGVLTRRRRRPGS